MPVSLADTSMLADAIAFLSGRARLTAEIGGAGRVGGLNVPPYPRLPVRQLPGGSDGGELLWLRIAELQLEAVGDLSGAPGSAQLERILVVAIEELQEIVHRTPGPGLAVVTAVRPGAGAYPLDLPNNQPRWVASRLLYYHPPLS